MAAIIRALIRQYNRIFTEIANPNVNDWFLMSSPWPVAIVLGCYLYFVKILGPRLMEGVPPFKLTRILQVYNLFQIAASAYITYVGLKYGWGGQYSFRCEPEDWSDDPNRIKIAGMLHTYFAVKLIDLLDTVFFVMRKKQNQISFLHVYHHAGVTAVAWAGTKWYSTGHGTFLAVINSAVHVVMYSYYFLTSVSDEYKKNLWWKKYITQLQIAQFFWLTFHFGQLIFSNPCGFPTFGLAIMVPQNLFMLILFADFYRKTYLQSPKKSV